jgi:hypothetical protein
VESSWAMIWREWDVSLREEVALRMGGTHLYVQRREALLHGYLIAAVEWYVQRSDVYVYRYQMRGVQKTTMSKRCRRRRHAALL